MVHIQDLEPAVALDKDNLIQVTSLGVTLSRTRSVLYLELGEFSHNQRDGQIVQVALTPPAAKQLAEALERAVEDYLHSSPETE